MKQILFVLLLATPFVSQAQRIKRSDLSVNERTIETTIVTLKQGFSTGFGIKYTAVNNVFYISFIGYGRKNTVIKNDDRIQLLLNSGTVIKFDSRVELPSNSSGIPNLYIHHYFIGLKEIEALKNNRISIVRIVSPNAHTDAAVAKKNSIEINKLSEAFLNEVNK